MKEITFGSLYGDLAGKHCCPFKGVTPGDWEVFCLQYLDKLVTYSYQEVTLRHRGRSQKAWVVKVPIKSFTEDAHDIKEIVAAYKRIFENVLVY
ncbi:hypothetical protein [Synechococcus phage S-B68]|nr:hypothetical protein [Synechococcus phage S-B68]